MKAAIAWLSIRMSSSLSLADLEHAWSQDPQGRHRASGGRRALDGFRYQLALSLEQFFQRLERGEALVETAFEGLGDLAQRDGDVVYLMQVKTTLHRSSLRHAVDEMLAVDAFLERSFPEMRPQVRFHVWCRRRKTPAEPRDLDAQALGLDGERAQRWRQVAPRVEPVEVRLDPFLSLVVRYFDRTANAFLTFEALLGRLLRRIADGDDSRRIAESLLELWSEHREPKSQPPGRLLASHDFQPSGLDEDSILVGDRPFLQDLRRGCFMARPARCRDILEAIDELTLDGTPGGRRGARERRLPVVWIEGAPGVGKSVLMLQVLEELVMGRHAVVHRLSPSIEQLAEALHFWNRDPQPAVIAVDDLFAPNQRRAEAWQRVHQVIVDGRWTVLPLLLTCGPTDYREAFEREARREGTFHVHTVFIEPLDPEERHDFAAWYRRRTGTPAPAIEESNFAAAAFLLDLEHRGQRPDIGQFAERLAERFRHQNLLDDILMLLAADGVGVQVPSRAFRRHEDFVDLLTDEGILRPLEGSTQLRMLHPQLARGLYDVLVPPSKRRQRARHLSRCFELLRSHKALADGLLQRLHPKNGSPNLDSTVRRQALEYIGDSLCGVSTAELVAGHVRLWIDAAKDSLDRIPPNLLGCVRAWLRDPLMDPAAWGQLWQVAWGLTPPEERRPLVRQALEWLPHHPELDEWNYVWQVLWKARDPRHTSRFEELAAEWLLDESQQAGWSYVFQALYEHGSHRGVHRESLHQAAFDGLRHSPVSGVDPHLWDKIWRLTIEQKVEAWDFVDALIYRLAGCRFPHLQDKGVRFLWGLRQKLAENADALSVDQRLINCLAQHRQRPMWGYLLQHQKWRELPSDSLQPVLVEWLEKHGNRDEWNYVWQAHLEPDPDPHLLDLGRRWLDGREDEAPWPFVWQRLLEHHAGSKSQREHLLGLGETWLTGRRDHDGWSHVWEHLVKHRPESGSLRQAGLRWLGNGDERSQWNYMWRQLLDLHQDDSEVQKQLLEDGLAWLEGRQTIAQWPFVWRRLAQAFEPSRKESSLDRDQLMTQGRQWLDARLNDVHWPLVWHPLMAMQSAPKDLTEAAYSWLRRHLDRQSDAWLRVFRRALDASADEPVLLDLGRRWLQRPTDPSEWSQMWEALALRWPWDSELFQLGETWLTAQSTRDSEAATAVRRRLQAMGPLQR